MIIYSSKYGTSEQIALWLAEDLKDQAIPLNSADLSEYSGIPVLVLPVYAGGFYQAKKAREFLKKQAVRRIVVVTVGLSDPKRSDTSGTLHQIVEKTFPEYETAVFSLRGGMDYHSLSSKDALMMWMLKKMIEKKPDEGENRELLDTYGTKFSLMDRKETRKTAAEISRIISGL